MLGRIDEQRDVGVGALVHVLHGFLTGNDGSTAQEDRHDLDRCEERLVLASADALTCPKVEPVTTGEVNRTR